MINTTNMVLCCPFFDKLYIRLFHNYALILHLLVGFKLRDSYFTPSLFEKSIEIYVSGALEIT